MKPVRVLVVDDSASMRALIRQTLSADKSITVCGEAANPLEAREAIKQLNPDVMTLDVEMPHMNGIEFLEKVMRLRPLPVIMVSSLTERGAMITIQAWATRAKPRQRECADRLAHSSVVKKSFGLTRAATAIVRFPLLGQ